MLATVILGTIAVVILSAWAVTRAGRNFLTHTVATLPASNFPAPADRYVCDDCGRDVTKFFRRRQSSHAWQRLGPVRVACRCGRAYLTGATEWDHLSVRERRKRVRDTFAFSIVFSLMSSVVGGGLYVLVQFVVHDSQTAFIVGVFIAALPFFLIQIAFWRGVLASLWRTRIAGQTKSP